MLPILLTVPLPKAPSRPQRQPGIDGQVINISCVGGIYWKEGKFFCLPQ